MAKKCFEDQNPLCCSICLDQLQDNISHGHNYCMDCIKDWDAHGNKETSCPQCRNTFTPRPVLNKNTCMFADMVERFKNTGLRDSSPTHFHGYGPTDCKIFTTQKTNNLKVSPECEDLRCKSHLCPTRFNDHTRERPTVIVVRADNPGNICSRHNRLLGVYCRTDQQFICTLCLKDAHRGHEAFSMIPVNEKSPEHRRPLAKKAHRGKSKTSGHGKSKSNKIMHGTGHRHSSGGHTRVSHANSGHKTGQQKSTGPGVHSHGHSHGAVRRKSRDGGHGDWIIGHGHARNWV